jgi:hypothetical protein
MVTPLRSLARRLLLPSALSCVLLAACGSGDLGVLSGDRLTVDPCRGDASRTFAPVRFEFDRLAWVHPIPSTGSIEMRRGHRATTESDLLLLQFADLPGSLAAWEADREAPLPLDGDAIRLSLVLNARCPDQVQPLVARGGSVRMTAFSPRDGGRIAGQAVFDLVDDRLRDAAGSPPAGSGMTLDFDLAVRSGRPQDVFTR